MNDTPAIVGSISELPPLTPRQAVQEAIFALEYIEGFGFLSEAIKGNEATHGARVLFRELSKARSMLVAVLAS